MKYSIYLNDRVEAISKTIDFFNKDTHHRLIFLSQLEFWEFEIDGLIEAFNSFNKRQHCWHQIGYVKGSINNLNIFIKNSVLNRFEFNNNDSKGYDAPWKNLSDLLNRYNLLLDNCVEYFDEKAIQAAIKVEGKHLSNLDNYKRYVYNLT